MDEAVDTLPSSRLSGLITLLPKIKQEEAKDRLIEQAFLAFQMGAGSEKTFGQYLQGIGLGDTAQQEQTITPEALAALKTLAKETEMRGKSERL